MSRQEEYIQNVMIPRMKDSISTGKARVEITLLDDSYRFADCTQQRASEIFNIETLKKILELIENGAR